MKMRMVPPALIRGLKLESKKDLDKSIEILQKEFNGEAEFDIAALENDVWVLRVSYDTFVRLAQKLHDRDIEYKRLDMESMKVMRLTFKNGYRVFKLRYPFVRTR